MRLHIKAPGSGIVMEGIYRFCSISRQGFFQKKARFEKERQMMTGLLEQIADYRTNKDARAGSRNLFFNLNIKSKYGLGINKFERLMAEYGGTLQALHIRVITTKSCARSRNYHNLANGLLLSGINELVVGDLTYLSIGKRRYYLFCLTDVYSARIVGYCVHQRMRATEAYHALSQWLSLRGQSNMINCCHHTDGGSQYFSNLYLNKMQKLKLKISVAANCLENGYAEQRNGLIKNHLLPTIKTLEGPRLQREFSRIFHFYNYERKQENLGWRSPVEFENYSSTLIDRPIKELYIFEER